MFINFNRFILVKNHFLLQMEALLIEDMTLLYILHPKYITHRINYCHIRR